MTEFLLLLEPFVTRRWMQRIWQISCNAWISLQRRVELRSLDMNTNEVILLKYELDGTMGWVREKT